MSASIVPASPHRSHPWSRRLVVGCLVGLGAALGLAATPAVSTPAAGADTVGAAPLEVKLLLPELVGVDLYPAGAIPHPASAIVKVYDSAEAPVLGLANLVVASASPVGVVELGAVFEAEPGAYMFTVTPLRDGDFDVEVAVLGEPGVAAAHGRVLVAIVDCWDTFSASVDQARASGPEDASVVVTAQLMDGWCEPDLYVTEDILASRLPDGLYLAPHTLAFGDGPGVYTFKIYAERAGDYDLPGAGDRVTFTPSETTIASWVEVIRTIIAVIRSIIESLLAAL
jgi:hypothetical protein